MEPMSDGASDKTADLELLRAVIRRDPGAWQAFFKRHERLILACLRRVYTRYHVFLPQEQLEDLVGMVCLDLVKDDYRKLRKYDPDRGYRLSSWIGLIATNIAHDALRRRGPPHTSTDDEDSPLAELRSGLPDPLEVLNHKERVQILAEAVKHLTPTDQEFIRLYYEEQQTPEEIAEASGVSVNTVYSRKNKVRGKLVRLVRGLTRTDLLRQE
jgi:RNA polymerase sigma-70 factor (ECF subfamily)